MLATTLTVVSNRASVTLPGATSTKDFPLIVGPAGNSTLRRIAATASATPETIRIAHAQSGAGFNRRFQTLIEAKIECINANLSNTDGVVPWASVQTKINRPVVSAEVITEAMVKTLIGQTMDVIIQNMTALLNLEA